LGPVLASDEEAVALGVVGDAVHHIGPDALGGRQNTGQIDAANHFPGLRIEARDPVGLPDVGENFALYPFQLVQILDWPALVRHFDDAGFQQGPGIPDADLPVARFRLHGPVSVHVDLLAVGRESPALALVAELALRCERRQVVDEANFGLVGHHQDAVLPDDDAFAEIIDRKVAPLHNLAGLEFYFAEGRLIVHTGAFVQKAVVI